MLSDKFDQILAGNPRLLSFVFFLVFIFPSISMENKLIK